MTWKSDSVEPSDKALFISSLLLLFNEWKDIAWGTVSPFCLAFLVWAAVWETFCSKTHTQLRAWASLLGGPVLPSWGHGLFLTGVGADTLSFGCWRLLLYSALSAHGQPFRTPICGCVVMNQFKDTRLWTSRDFLSVSKYWFDFFHSLVQYKKKISLLVLQICKIK